MISFGGLSRVPVEVISLILDWVDLMQLLLVSRVCAKWRAVARSHPVFWRDIRLAALSSTALAFFEARLNQTTESSINVSIQLTDMTLSNEIQSVVLPAIARNLRRLRHIGLDLHYQVAPDLLRVLVDPAPRLQHVALRFYHIPEGRSSVLLPPDLFSGTCPKLTAAALTYVDFPAQPIRAFDHVRSLLFDFGSPRTFDFGLFSHFPALTSLTVFGDSCVGTERGPPQENATIMPELTALEVCLSLCDYDSIILSIPNFAQIRSVKCWQPSAELTRLFITHLEGEVGMNFLCAELGLVHILLFSPSSGCSRTLIEYAPRVLDDWPHDTLFDPDFLKRVTTLRLDAQLAYLAPHFEELPACHTVEVVVDETDFPPSLSATAPVLRLPALKTLVVELADSLSIQPRTVSASALSAFLTLLVGHREKRLLLELQGITVSGESETLRSAFELAHVPT